MIGAGEKSMRAGISVKSGRAVGKAARKIKMGDTSTTVGVAHHVTNHFALREAALSGLNPSSAKAEAFSNRLG